MNEFHQYDRGFAQENSFQEKYWNEYKKTYNECFYKMRKALEIEPINFYSDYVAEWNQNAVKLYLKNGFSIKKKEKVR